MERECWAELSAAISQVELNWSEPTRVLHRTALMVRVYLWSALHDRPMCWGCEPKNWSPQARPPALPDQSTLSRRTRGEFGRHFQQFLEAVALKMAGRPGAAIFKRMDGKALPIAAHSKDPDARWGRGAGQKSNGYKLHLIRSSRVMPEQWAVTPLNVDERHMARRMIKRVQGTGYLSCDALYDGSGLHDYSAAAQHQLVCPRRKPNSGLGHRYQSRHRLRCIDMLEPPAKVNNFGPTLYAQRSQIERDLGNMVSFGGGLQCLPAWVRRIWRVRNWVHAKLLINAARIRHRKRVHA